MYNDGKITSNLLHRTMKKYKYPFYNRITQNKERERFKQLDKINKRNLRINRFIGYSFLILYFLLVGTLITLTISVKKILNGVWSGLFIALMFIIIIVLPVVVVIVVYQCIYKKVPSVTYKNLTAELIRKITKPLVEYYKISSNYFVTKCYSCSEVGIENKDVIVFVYDGKLRIVNDFFHSIKDFGCYEFDYKDFTYFNIVDNGIVKTIIKTTDCEFVLGYKAKTFIKKNFER